MKVYDLCCENEHRFEGWFGSEQDFSAQFAAHQITCPICASLQLRKLVSAPRLNLAGVKPSAPFPDPREAQAAWLAQARQVIARTVDVGTDFAEQARRMHYDEIPERGIRGIATRDERIALAEEGIAVATIHIPAALKESLQ